MTRWEVIKIGKNKPIKIDRKPTPRELGEITLKLIFDKFRLLAVNAFEWSGLPKGILPRHIEGYLFDDGQAIFFRDPEMSYMCLKCTPGVGVNVYGDPLSYRATGYGYNKQYNADDCVIINNNLLRQPTAPFVQFYAAKIAEAERTMDVNVKACKTPVIIRCGESELLTFKRIFELIDGDTPAIFGDKGLNIDGIQALDTKASFLGNDLMDYKQSVESELLTFLGIDNVAVDKKERLVSDEANANNQIISSFMRLQLDARRDACRQINAKWGLSISVKPRQTMEGGGADEGINRDTEQTDR